MINISNLILSRIYWSGTRPTLPPSAPRHQSPVTWLESVRMSPRVKESSLSLRAQNENAATASSVSPSALGRREWGVF